MADVAGEDDNGRYCWGRCQWQTLQGGHHWEKVDENNCRKRKQWYIKKGSKRCGSLAMF